jgi:hypothetical protein
MAEAAVKYLYVEDVTTNVGGCTNVLSFMEEHIMEITPQFVPNTFQGPDVKQDHKWFVLTIVVDSETNIFDTPHHRITAANNPFTVLYVDFILADGSATSHRITAANNPFTVLYVDFILADGSATRERWTYQASRSYVLSRDEGKIDMDAARNTIEYQILMYGSRAVTHP